MLVLHTALYFGQQLSKESLQCPNQMRAAAGVMIEDAPMQFDASSSSSHSIKVKGTLKKIPLEMHGVILHLRTSRLPTTEEIELSTVKVSFSLLMLLKINRGWDPYSKEFAR
jgi:hypothetical protein